MTEKPKTTPLTGYNAPTPAPSIGERLKGALGVSKPAPAAVRVTDDISILREKVRDYKGGDGLIARKLESYVSAIAIEKFAYNGGTLSDDEMSAIASVVLPGRSIRNGSFIAEHWSPPFKDADIKVSELLSLKEAKREGLPRIDEQRLSNDEATAAHNILTGIAEPIQISAIRQGILQSLLVAGWSGERPEYQQARLDAITAALFENNVIARTDTPKGRAGAAGQFVLVHRSKLSIVAQWASARF
jgi:hypothetical protein